MMFHNFQFYIDLAQISTIFAICASEHPINQIWTRLNFENLGQMTHIQGVPSRSTPFILQIEQRKLNSCSMGCLSETLQGLRYTHLNFYLQKI